MKYLKKFKNSPTIPLSSRKHLWFGTVFLFLTTIILFRKFLSPAGSLVLSNINGDLATEFAWWRKFGFEELKRGHLALWNPHVYCGEPFFGGCQSALLYPPNWFFMVLPLPFALNLSMALHVFLAGWFTLMWITARGSHPISALMGALMYMFGGAYFLHLGAGHLSNLCTMAWIPLVFLIIDRYRIELKTKWILMGMTVLAIQIFSGHMQYVYYTWVISFIYVLFNLPDKNNKIQKYLIGLASMFFGALLLSAVQLLAGWAAMSESSRPQMDMDFVNTVHLFPGRLLCLLMPNFFGGNNAYWGICGYSEGDLFISVSSLTLVVFALKYSQHPQKKLTIWLILVLILIAAGNQSPLFILFSKYFPFFNHFEGHAKLNIFISLFLILLAVSGMDEVFRNPSSLKTLGKGALTGAVLFLLAAFLFLITPISDLTGALSRNTGFQSLNFKIALDRIGFHWPEMTKSLFECGCTLMILALLAFMSVRRPLFRYGFFIVALIELLLFASSNMPYFDLTSLEQEISKVQKTYDQSPGDYRVLVDEDYATETSGFSIDGGDPFSPLRYGKFIDSVWPEKVDHPENDVNYFPQTLGLTRLQYLFRFKDSHLEMQKLTISPVPRAALVNHWKMGTLENTLAELKNPSFDFKQTVFLESIPM